MACSQTGPPLNGIVLTGMMGTGKTRVGQAVSQSLGWSFFDLDSVVEEKVGLQIPEIFRDRGEAFFRRAERGALEEVLTQVPCVIATGGGALCHASSWAHIPPSVVVVWLSAPVEVLATRVEGGGGRPLLEGKDIRAELKRLLEQRHTWYGRAGIKVDSGHGTPEDVARVILDALEGKLIES